jgi:signal peptidase I
MSTSTQASAGRAAGVIDTIKTIIWALILALALRTFLFQPFTIPSDSMEPGLLQGDYMVVSKFDYGFSRFSTPLPLPGPGGRLLGRAARRGDVIVFKLPRDPKENYVKRLIGLPGDRVQVVHGVVTVNGQAWKQQALGLIHDPDSPARIVTQVREIQPDGRSHLILRADEDHDGENTDVYVVPAGHYFFMGDNRDNSLDSRWPEAFGVGYVPAENLEGRARMILLSWTQDAGLLKPWTWLDLNWSRFFRPLS